MQNSFNIIIFRVLSLWFQKNKNFINIVNYESFLVNQIFKKTLTNYVDISQNLQLIFSYRALTRVCMLLNTYINTDEKINFPFLI